MDKNEEKALDKIREYCKKNKAIMFFAEDVAVTNITLKHLVNHGHVVARGLVRVRVGEGSEARQQWELLTHDDEEPEEE